MTTATKINVFLALGFIAIWTCNGLRNREKGDEIIVGGVHVSKGPVISAVNGLLGKGVDSIKVCDCLVPKVYTLIETHPLLVEKFKQTGDIFILNGALNDSFAVIFANCVKANILDTSWKIQLPPEYKLMFKERLVHLFASSYMADSFDIDSLSDCLVEKLNGNITIKEYFSDDYFKVPKIKSLITACRELYVKPK